MENDNTNIVDEVVELYPLNESDAENVPQYLRMFAKYSDVKDGFEPVGNNPVMSEPGWYLYIEPINISENDNIICRTDPKINPMFQDYKILLEPDLKDINLLPQSVHVHQAKVMIDHAKDYWMDFAIVHNKLPVVNNFRYYSDKYNQPNKIFTVKNDMDKISLYASSFSYRVGRNLGSCLQMQLLKYTESKLPPVDKKLDKAVNELISMGYSERSANVFLNGSDLTFDIRYIENATKDFSPFTEKTTTDFQNKHYKILTSVYDKFRNDKEIAPILARLVQRENILNEYTDTEQAKQFYNNSTLGHSNNKDDWDDKNI